MDIAASELRVNQLLVLGRGMDGSKLSTASFERATAAEAFCLENSAVDRVVFSSGHSSMADMRGEQSEAMLMIAASHFPDQVQVYIEEESTNTFENFLNSAILLNPERTTGVLAHRTHLPRALMIARLALQGPVVGIPAELWGARPESRASSVIEKLQLTWAYLLLRDVTPGDIATLTERNIFDQRVKQRVGKAVRSVSNISRIRLPQQYN